MRGIYKMINAVGREIPEEVLKATGKEAFKGAYAYDNYEYTKAGVNVLMNITQKLGGIDLLASILATFMTSRTAAPIMGVTGGIMSWFSSANGVVFPTLIPTVPEIAQQVGGASIIQMVTSIVCSATVAGISPLSTGGSLIMASYAQESGCDEKEQQKMFGTLFALSAGVVAIVFVLGIIGVLGFIG